MSLKTIKQWSGRINQQKRMLKPTLEIFKGNNKGYIDDDIMLEPMIN